MLITAAVLWTLAQVPHTPEPLTEYEKQFLSVEDDVTVSDGESSRSLVFTQGKYRRELSPPEFLRALGQVEQAERYQTRRTLAAVLVLGAMASVLAGMVAVAGPSDHGNCGPPSDPGFGACVERMAQQIRSQANAGGAAPLLISAGIAAALFGGAVAVYPSLPEPAELRRLADEHNQALKHRLSGLTLRVDRRF